MSSSQQITARTGGSANPPESVLASLSGQAAVKYHPTSEPPVEGCESIGELPPGSLVAPFDEALSRLCVATTREAAYRRRRERALPAELFGLLTSPSWQDALTYDEVHGFGVVDSFQVLVGIGLLCARHLTEYDGDDVAGRVCIPCEFGFPERQRPLVRVDCDHCQGSCAGSCDAGAGTWTERQAGASDSTACWCGDGFCDGCDRADVVRA